jgi:hypothetical protein
MFYSCTFQNGTAGGLRTNVGHVYGCLFSNIGVISLRTTGDVSYCKFVNGANNASTFLQFETNHLVATCNLFLLSGITKGINSQQSFTVLEGNRFYDSGGSAQGITAGSSGLCYGRFSNNYFEGCSTAIRTSNAGTPPDLLLLKDNYYYNNTTNTDLTGVTYFDDDGTTLSSSAFENAGAGDFTFNNTAGAGATIRAITDTLTDSFPFGRGVDGTAAGGGGGGRQGLHAIESGGI